MKLHGSDVAREQVRGTAWSESWNEMGAARRARVELSFLEVFRGVDEVKKTAPSHCCVDVARIDDFGADGARL